MDNNHDTGGIVLSTHKKGYYKIDGMAAFKDNKLVGWFNGDESIGQCWIAGQKINAYESIKTSSKEKVANTIICRVTNSSCKIKVKFENGKPVANIYAYVEADLRKESQNLNVNFLTHDIINSLDKKLAVNVKTEISDAIKKGQKVLKTDAFGIGFSLYRQYPKLWHSSYEKRWDQIFPTLKINVYVDAKVLNTGTSIKKY